MYASDLILYDAYLQYIHMTLFLEIFLILNYDFKYFCLIVLVFLFKKKYTHIIYIMFNIYVYINYIYNIVMSWILSFPPSPKKVCWSPNPQYLKYDPMWKYGQSIYNY